MTEIIVVEASLEDDLQEFSRYLWQQKLPHRIVEENSRQLLLVGSKSDAEHVSLAYRDYLAGKTELPDIQRIKSTELPNLGRQLLKTPVTLSCLLLSILGFFIVYFDKDYHLVHYLTFFQFERVGFHTVFTIPQGEYWRLITPIFLHFGVLHIVFNALWLWDLGRRIEIIQGSDRMIGIVLVMGLGSNLAQYLYAQIGVFGGMSGVIYGLLGYGWFWSYLCPEKSLHIPKPVMIFMLVWLVLCVLGFASWLGVGEVANAAHVGGLVMGIMLGLGAGIIARVSGNS
ncbi:MAG: rhomboid family intramembrane serine protease [Pseudomonadales bacterium]